MIIYGSKQCPDCRKCKATLEANGQACSLDGKGC
jgi:arsenate reductase-like glutaredoxin family protein